MLHTDRLWEACSGDGAAVMAIINVTPDSFYAGSRMAHMEELVRRCGQAVDEGARILDVGGYSSRPGAQNVTPEEELSRVRRAMEVIRERHPEVAVSIDTFRSTVARAVMDEYGDCIINDISAGSLDGAITGLAAQKDVPYIAMHMRGTPADMQQNTDYADVAADVEAFFSEKLAQLSACGVEKVVIDAGFGFAKTLWQNYELLAGLPRLTALGAPVLVGVSRKSMIYKVTGGGPEDALAGTAALHWEALRAGARILRAHDVKAAADVIKMYEYYKEI